MKTKTAILLAVIPVLLFCASLYYRGVKGPYYYGNNLDPAYAYLLNSLNIALLTPPAHTDHPGTPLQLLGAAILYARWLPGTLSGNFGSLQDAVLLSPESFLTAMNLSLNVLTALAVLAAGFLALRYCGLFPALILQISYLLFFQIQLSLTDVSPEPFMIFWSLLLIMALLPEIFGEEPSPEGKKANRRAVLTGMILGIGTAAKVTFLPLLGFIMVLKGYTRKLTALGSCLASFMLVTLPILPYYGRIYNWFMSLLIHKGKYGRGEVGFPDIHSYFENLTSMLKAEPFILILLVTYLVVFLLILPSQVLSGFREKCKFQKLFVVGIAVIILQITITAKHPGVHYMLPAMTVTSLLNAALAFVYMQNRKSRPEFRLAGGAGLVILVIGAIFSIKNAKTMIHDYSEFATNAQTIAKTLNEESNCLVAAYYGSSTKEYALSFGDSFANHVHATELEQLYPRALQYNLFRNYFKNFDRILDPNSIEYMVNNRNACILLYGTPFGDRFENRYLIVKPLIVKNAQGLYKLEGLAE